MSYNICPACGTKTDMPFHTCDRTRKNQSEFSATIGSASSSRAQARVDGIKEIQRLCEEALDHDTGWPMFCKLVRSRLEIETALMPNGASSGAPANNPKT